MRTAPDPEALAALHKRCFVTPRPYTSVEFQRFLDDPTIGLHQDNHGFLLCRYMADEAELLTLAVDPDHRRAGHGRRLLQHFLNDADTGGTGQVFLEVSDRNGAARALYSAAGFHEAGRRKAYYAAPDGDKHDAIVMVRRAGARNAAAPG